MVTRRRPVRRAPGAAGDIRPCPAWPRSGILRPPRAPGRERVTIGAWGRASTIPGGRVHRGGLAAAPGSAAIRQVDQ